MFIPMRMTFGAGQHSSELYDRQIELTTRQLQAFEHEAGNMTVPLTEVGADLRTSVGAAFASQGGTGASGKWTALSEPYAAWKEKHVAGAPILVGIRHAPKGSEEHPDEAGGWTSSGQMRAQMLDPLATYVAPRRLLYAPLSDIAGWHETGTDHMPARPPVDVSLAFLHSIDRAFARWLAAVMAKVGL